MALDCEGQGSAGNWRLVDYYTSNLFAAAAATAAAAAECTRIYEEALSKGYINTRNSVIVVTGANGSGKTHVREAISNRPPPPVRESTALSEDPITFSILDASDGNWRVMDMEQQARMLTVAMATWTALKRNEEVNPHPSILSDSTSPLLTKDTSPTVTSSSTAMQLPPHTATPTLEPVGPVLLTAPSQHRPPPQQTRCDKAYHEKPHPIKTDFLDRIGQTQSTEEKPYNYDLVYLFDTGGQPAFHAILPLFFPMIMFVIFVLKLSEKLGHHPVVNYFVHGKLIGASYTSPLSHLEIARHSFSTVQSQMLAQQHSGKGLPKMMVVGTHRDKEWHCSESIQEKNRKLSEILSSSFQEHLIYHSAEGKSLVFPLDAKHRKQKDCQVMAEIRQAITMATSAIESKRTPLSWHILELALRQLAGKLGRGFLTRTECITEATKLSISHQVLDAALDHFVHLNTILYYRTVLPNLVFILAQPLMQKMTELVQKTHALRGQVPNTRTPIDGKWFKFRDQGIVTLDILESFPDGYLEGIFTAADLVQLMEHKLLISLIDQSSYFMPVLLPDLSPEEVAQHRAGPDSAIAPLTILFPCNLVPTGLFCSLVSSLLSDTTIPQLRLRSKPSDRALVDCVASNCIKFSLPDNAGSAVLVNTHAHLELHLNTPSMEDPAPLCFKLKTKVLASIATAAHTLHFDEHKPQCGFLCESSTPHAKVRMTPERHWFDRLVLGDFREVEVDSPIHPAVLTKEHGWVCSLDDCICGQFQKRHTVWLQPSCEQSSVGATGGGGTAGGEVAATGGGGAAGGVAASIGWGGATGGEVVAIGGDVATGGEAGHPSDIIFDKFPECKTATLLRPSDLGQVLRVLHDAGLAAKWRAIGQTLTVSDADLSDFEARFSGDSSLCLLQVVASWLRGQKRHPDPPSWCRLVWAVADPHGGATVYGGKRIAATFKALCGLVKLAPSSVHAKETPSTLLLDDFSGSPHLYNCVDEAMEALSRELLAVAHRWVQVGVFLGVEYYWLEQRRSARQTDQQNLREVLRYCLDTLGEAITLQHLVEAVEHNAGGSDPTLAAAIKSKLTGLRCVPKTTVI